MSPFCLFVLLLSFLVGTLLKSIDASNAVINGTVGSRAILKCHTSQRTAVDWWYQRTDGDNTRQICLNGEIVVEMRSRFSISSKNTGDYNLIIADVDLADSGLYTCVEDAGLGQRTTLQLMVTEAEVVSLKKSKSSSLQTSGFSGVNKSAEFREQTGVSVAAIVPGYILFVCMTVVVVVVVMLSIVCRGGVLRIAHNYPTVELILEKCFGVGKRHGSPSKSPVRKGLNRSIQTTPGLKDNVAEPRELKSLLQGDPQLSETDEPTPSVHDASTPKANPGIRPKRTRLTPQETDSSGSCDKENRQHNTSDGGSNSHTPVRDYKTSDVDAAYRNAFEVKNVNERITLLPTHNDSGNVNESFSEV